MEYRETVLSTASTSELYRTRNLPSGSWLNQNTTSGTDHVKYVKSVDTPGYFRLCKMGEFLPINPFEVGYHKEIFRPCGSASWTKKLRSTGVATLAGEGKLVTTFARLEVPPVDQSLVDSLALQAMARAAEAEWDVLTFLGELNSTINTVAAIGRQFNGFTRRMAIQAIEARRNPWRKFQELWLGARYGVRPMVYDVMNIVNAFNSKWKDGDLIKGTAWDVENGSDSFYTESVADENTTRLITKTLEWERRYRAFAYIELELAIKKKFGASFISTAWELTTLSFVVDWFVDIGTWLQAAQAHFSGALLGVGTSVKTTITEHHYRNTDWHDGPTWTVTGTHIQGQHNTYQSQVYTRAPTSGLPIPGFDPNLSIPKYIDLVALFLSGKRDVNRILSGRR